ncbi:hypothetical protein IW261DRAFT_1574383 [Armillaria novae-zelandiae]|uniref:Uncharacterized protein n=1 Tax=Armillaria novae-zelandiae TaxID=153914 RepID=A0AA39TUA6_9AGAR|nr:hypothetical protein IW261DRAFT_1574383 [Armillaria novae-zelandiae]
MPSVCGPVPINITLPKNSDLHMLLAVHAHMKGIKFKSIKVVDEDTKEQSPLQNHPVSKDLPHSQAAEPMFKTKSFSERMLDRFMQRTVYCEFMATVTDKSPQGDDSQLCDKLTKLAMLIQDVTKYSNKILNDVGVGKDVAEAQEV